ncbi:hypothetical protein F7725_018232 [Dissostichus mawsoni]|uniref:Uncharacterized protein n=1 Tax=Dissostichus mawsoni TaxID=36200 RepID=A0A7J5XQW2_DISMA|nr:hypothetical protein F7725_018232 [Dissostichus mawsoni]
MDSRSSHMYLQVWCGVLTVAMVVMAALLISIHPKSTEVSTSVTGEDQMGNTDDDDDVFYFLGRSLYTETR